MPTMSQTARRWRRVLAFGGLLLLAAGSAFAQAENPAADPKAMVLSGGARFTVLTPQLIRMEWSADGNFEDRASLVFINRRLPVPRYSTATEEGWLVLKTEALELRYRQGAGKFAEESLRVSLQVNGESRLWKPGTRDRGNLLGTTRTLDDVNGATRLDPGLISRDGWAVVDDSQRPLLDGSTWPWVAPRPEGERQDLYFFGYGHEYQRALGDFTRVAGKIPLPPRFVFGAWWSRYWAYTDKELMELVEDFRAHDVPLDVLVIDMDWHQTFNYAMDKGAKDDSGHSLGWTGYTWDRNYFPQPQRFLDWVHRQGLRATLNLHPASGVQPHEEQYPEMARAMGIDPETRQYVKFDIVDKRFAENYLKILHHPLERQGIDFFWLDWQQEKTTALPGLNPTFWLNYVHSTDMERRGKRPLIYHRWGGLGNHRYQIGFSGDVISTWESLAFQPRFTATAANVGYGYWSHDIGGHMPGKVDAELFTRWVQFGVFSPVLRTHATKNPEAERRIWAYPPQYADAMRDAFQLRYALIPYIYTAARQAYDTGISLLRPMYYDHPEAPEAYRYRGQYMFGDSLLVAPVTGPLNPLHLLAAEAVWLPEGEWVEWSSGSRMKGSVVMQRNYALEEIPVFAKAGSIVPLQPKMRSSGEKPVDPLILTIFPGGPSSARLYEDEGHSLGYQGSEFAWTTIRTERPDDTTLRVRVEPVVGSFPGLAGARGYEIRLFESWPPDSVRWNGVAVPFSPDGTALPGWRYDGDSLTTIIQLPRTSLARPVEVSVGVSAEKAAHQPLLDGAVGRLARIRRLFRDVNNKAPDSLLRLATTGRRIELQPEIALAELQGFSAAQKTAEADLRQDNPNAWRLLWSLQVSASRDKLDGEGNEE